MQIQQALAEASQRLQATSDSARADAEILLCHVLAKSRAYLFTWADQELATESLPQFYALLEQRIQGIPIAYLIGYRDFWTLRLKVTADTLIPRPETELLVEHALQHLPEQGHLLDLGTGTGAIALAIASERPDATLVACDYSLAALDVAKHNAQNNHLNQVKFVHSSWFSQIHPQLFDVIVSNPPYIDPQDAHLQQGDVRFEPLSALIAENHGLADIDTIIQQAPQWLKPHGWLLLEHGYNQGKTVVKLLEKQGFQNAHCLPDWAGNDRVSLGKKGY